MLGKVEDTDYMEAATTSDPAYIIFNNELNTFPASLEPQSNRYGIPAPYNVFPTLIAA